jgi:hypothetical protein
MLEEQLYFVVIYERWKPDAAWAIYQPLFMEIGGHLGVPGFLRRFVSSQIRKQTLRALHGQGTGRHTPEEVIGIGKRLIDATAELCEGPFYFGDKPSTLDATVYAFCESIVQAPFEGPLKEHTAAKLGHYLDHVRARYYTPPSEKLAPSAEQRPVA